MNLIPQTVQELQDKIKEVSKGADGTFEDAQWFVAYHYAEMIMDAYSVKDMARSLISGGFKLNKIETEEEIMAALVYCYYPDWDKVVSYEEVEDDMKKVYEEYANTIDSNIKQWYTPK